jgi:hypothetical protein
MRAAAIPGPFLLVLLGDGERRQAGRGMTSMKRAVVAVLVAACVLGFSSDGLARRGVAHRSGAGVVRNPTVLLASPAPQVPALKNRIPAPVASENVIRRSGGGNHMIAVDDRNRLPFRPLAVRLLQGATAAGSRNTGTAASAQRFAAVPITSSAFALDRSCSLHVYHQGQFGVCPGNPR